MSASDRKKTASAPLADLRALRGNLGETLRRRRAENKAGSRAETAGAAATAPLSRPESEPAAGKPPESGGIILASYNIHKCVGTDKIFDPQRIISVIAGLRADILALQEVDKRFGARHGLLDMAELERETGLRPVPIHPIAPQGQGWHGNALFFRAGNICSIEQIALPGVEPRGALIVDFYFKAGPLRIIAAHFGLLRRSRALQAEAILAFLKTRQTMPTVLLGDLNEWRSSKNSSLNGLHAYFVEKADAAPSFPSRFPLLTLDRVFAAPPDLVRSLAVYDTPLARRASDHLPIQALIHLPPAAEQTIQAETPTELPPLP